MELCLTVFAPNRYALAQPRAGVTGGVVIAYGRAIANHIEWEAGFTEVWDLTYSGAIDFVPSDIGALQALEDETASQLKGSRTIVVTPRSPVLFSVQFYARLMKSRGREVVGVRTQAEAADLLGIDALPVLDCA